MTDMRQKALDMVKEVIYFILATAGAFAYVLLVELIISFLALSYIQMNIETMLIVASCGAALFDVYYIIRKVSKIRKNSRKI